MLNPSINLFNLLYPCPSALPISILCILQFCQHPYFLPPPPMMTAHMNAFNALYGAGRTMTPPNYNASPAFHASMPHPNHAHLYAGPMPSQVSSRNRISVQLILFLGIGKLLIPKSPFFQAERTFFIQLDCICCNIHSFHIIVPVMAAIAVREKSRKQ